MKQSTLYCVAPSNACVCTPARYAASAASHQRRLRNAEVELRQMVDLLAPLGERAELLAVQLPAGFGPGDLGALSAFLARVPTDHRCAVEVRHPAFFDGGPADRALAGLLADRGAEWTTFDTTTLFARPPTSDAEREAWAAKPRLPRRAVAVGNRPPVRLRQQEAQGVYVHSLVYPLLRLHRTLATMHPPQLALT